MSIEESGRLRVFVARDFSSKEPEQALKELAEKRGILHDLIVPGLEADGGEILRDVILPGIIEADRVLVLADEPNANVGFEAGLAIGFGKPTAIVTWSTEHPDWLQEPPFINTLVHHVEDISMLEAVLDSEEVWQNPISILVPAVPPCSTI